MTATSTAIIAYEPTGRPARAAGGAAASGVVEGRGGAVPTGVGLTGAADTLRESKVFTFPASLCRCASMGGVSASSQ